MVIINTAIAQDNDADAIGDRLIRLGKYISHHFLNTLLALTGIKENRKGERLKSTFVDRFQLCQLSIGQDWRF